MITPVFFFLFKPTFIPRVDLQIDENMVSYYDHSCMTNTCFASILFLSFQERPTRVQLQIQQTTQLPRQEAQRTDS